MTMRTEPALNLPRSPLIFVLAQVRFSPVLTMKEKIPAIQDAMRKQGYPGFATRRIEVETFAPGASAPTKEEAREQWEFLNKDRTSSILVDQESVVLQTTRYPAFEDYLEKLTIALNTIQEHAEPSLMLRLGLRYVDLVSPIELNDLSYYVKPELRGMPFSDLGEKRAMMCESIVETDKRSKLVVRYVEGVSGFAFPPDLLPMSLAFTRNPVQKSRFGLLDFDHFTEQSMDYNVETGLSQAWLLHGVLEKAFKASVTPAALKEWGVA
jgi:uncharacterized protein (TIGR04255 family)